MSQHTVDGGMEEFVTTALAGDLDGHMAVISPRVKVFGVPGCDTLGVDDWYR